MPMRLPAGGRQIHLDVTTHGRFIAELDDRPSKIRPAFATEETRVKDTHGTSVQRAQMIAAKTLLLPEALQ